MRRRSHDLLACCCTSPSTTAATMPSSRGAILGSETVHGTHTVSVDTRSASEMRLSPPLSPAPTHALCACMHAGQGWGRPIIPSHGRWMVSGGRLRALGLPWYRGFGRRGAQGPGGLLVDGRVGAGTDHRFPATAAYIKFRPQPFFLHLANSLGHGLSGKPEYVAIGGRGREWWPDLHQNVHVCTRRLHSGPQQLPSINQVAGAGI